MRWLVPLVLAVLLAGCQRAPEAGATVEPPAGGEWAECPPSASRPEARPFRTSIADDAEGRESGVHRLDRDTFLWVWANHTDTLREDRLTRAPSVHVSRDSTGLLHLCVRADLATPTSVDPEPRSYVVAARILSLDPMPEGPVRVTVNWIAGCPCSPLPRGNVTALFE